jgi:hypothetical protein
LGTDFRDYSLTGNHHFISKVKVVDKQVKTAQYVLSTKHNQYEFSYRVLAEDRQGFQMDLTDIHLLHTM